MQANRRLDAGQVEHNCRMLFHYGDSNLDVDEKTGLLEGSSNLNIIDGLGYWISDIYSKGEKTEKVDRVVLDTLNSIQQQLEEPVVCPLFYFRSGPHPGVLLAPYSFGFTYDVLATRIKSLKRFANNPVIQVQAQRVIDLMARLPLGCNLPGLTKDDESIARQFVIDTVCCTGLHGTYSEQVRRAKIASALDRVKIGAAFGEVGTLGDRHKLTGRYLVEPSVYSDYEERIIKKNAIDFVPFILRKKLGIKYNEDVEEEYKMKIHPHFPIKLEPVPIAKWEPFKQNIWERDLRAEFESKGRHFQNQDSIFDIIKIGSMKYFVFYKANDNQRDSSYALTYNLYIFGFKNKNGYSHFIENNQNDPFDYKHYIENAPTSNHRTKRIPTFSEITPNGNLPLHFPLPFSIGEEDEPRFIAILSREFQQSFVPEAV